APAPLLVPKVKLRDEDAVVAMRGVRRESGAAQVGDRLGKKSPLVKEARDAFVDVVPEGLTRDLAVVAQQLMVTTEADGTTRTLYAGQWVNRDDRFVKLHPHMFTAPPIDDESNESKG